MAHNNSDKETVEMEAVNVTKGVKVSATTGQLWTAGVSLVIATIFLWSMKSDQASMREDINKIQSQMQKMQEMVYELYYQGHKTAINSMPNKIINP
jgi:mannitol-specific phosphotransferase system IIBC component